jgi:hypothetical protein
MSSEQLSFCANVSLGKSLLGKCLSGQMSFWAIAFPVKCRKGNFISDQIVFLIKCHLSNCLSGQMSLWVNVFLANVFWANVFLGKCLSWQMSCEQMSFWANVVWAKDSGQMSLGKCRIRKRHRTVLLGLQRQLRCQSEGQNVGALITKKNY